MLIVDAKNPKGCDDCPIFDCEKGICKVRNKRVSSMPPSECPIIDNENGWTPLKDRPPVEYDNYMCTMSNGEVQECTFVPKNIKGRIAGWSTCDADGFKWLAEEEVIAWQPLPKPYESEET